MTVQQEKIKTRKRTRHDPEWANYEAIDSFGHRNVFEAKPRLSEKYAQFVISVNFNEKVIEKGVCTDNWQESLTMIKG